MTKEEIFKKERSEDEMIKIYKLANWLQYKACELFGPYWRWHMQIQGLIRGIELFHPEYEGRYYNEYFYPYLVQQEDLRSYDWEKMFPADYESLICEFQEEMRVLL